VFKFNLILFKEELNSLLFDAVVVLYYNEISVWCFDSWNFAFIIYQYLYSFYSFI